PPGAPRACCPPHLRGARGLASGHGAGDITAGGDFHPALRTCSHLYSAPGGRRKSGRPRRGPGLSPASTGRPTRSPAPRRADAARGRGCCCRRSRRTRRRGAGTAGSAPPPPGRSRPGACSGRSRRRTPPGWAAQRSRSPRPPRPAWRCRRAPPRSGGMPPERRWWTGPSTRDPEARSSRTPRGSRAAPRPRAARRGRLGAACTVRRWWAGRRGGRACAHSIRRRRSAYAARMTVRRLEPHASTIFAEVSQLATRHDAVNLGQGFPDTDGPASTIEAAARPMREGRHQYPPGAGVPELRSAISGHVADHTGLTYDPDTEVLVTVGATEAIAGAVVGLVEPDAEVVVIEPFYDSYAATVAMAGATRRSARLVRAGDSYRLDVDSLREAFSPRTRAVLLNTPHNPTGAV